MRQSPQTYQYLAATVEVDIGDLVAGIKRYVSLFNANLMANGGIEVDPSMYGAVQATVNDRAYRCNVHVLNSCSFEPTGCILQGYIPEGSPLHLERFHTSELYVRIDFSMVYMNRIANELFSHFEADVTQGILIARSSASSSTSMTTSHEHALLTELFNQRKPR